MNQSQVINLDVKLSLEVDNETSLKRIPAVQTHKDLHDQCRQLINKRAIPKVSKFNIVYFDAENERIKVEDDSDLQMAYAVALSSGGRLKLHIEIGAIQAQPTAQKPEPVTKPEYPVLPVMPSIFQQPILQPSLVAQVPIIEQPVIVTSPVVHPQPIIEEVKVQAQPETDQKKGKNANKAQKPKEKGLPRKALKTLMQQEFEKQSRIIFDKLLKDKGIGFSVSDAEESKEQAHEQVVHVGVACDGCGESPILGVRYKCAVCKDFDYCANCEEKLDHDHPFLKIKKAGGAPAVMVTVLSDEPQVNADASTGAQQQQREHHGHGHQHHGHGRGHGWKHMVNGFLEKMGLDPEHVKEQMKEHFKNGQNPWSFANGERCGGQNGHWKNKRAILVTKPTEVLEARVGQVLLPSIEVRNSTHWPWKQGCFLGMDESVNLERMPIEFVNVPVNFEVKGQENFKMTIPITVLPTARPSDEIYEFVLCFRGPNGNQFGEQIPLKIKIVAATSQLDENAEVEMYRIASKLHDQKLGKSFEDCLNAVKQANCNEVEAIKVLKTRQQ